MNTFSIAVLACLVAVASTKPSGLWGGHGVVAHAAHVVPSGPTTLIGASGVVGPHGASGPTGAVNGHGAVGPNGEHNALDHGYAGVVAGGYGGYGHGLVGIGHDDGQWHGEGLLESQDYAGHGAVAYAAPVVVAAHVAPIAVGAPTVTVNAAHHGVYAGHGLVGGHGLGLVGAHGVGLLGGDYGYAHGAHY